MASARMCLALLLVAAVANGISGERDSDRPYYGRYKLFKQRRALARGAEIEDVARFATLLNTIMAMKGQKNPAPAPAPTPATITITTTPPTTPPTSTTPPVATWPTITTPTTPPTTPPPTPPPPTTTTTPTSTTTTTPTTPTSTTPTTTTPTTTTPTTSTTTLPTTTRAARRNLGVEDIYLGCDNAGLKLEDLLKAYLRGDNVEDESGAYDEVDEDDEYGDAEEADSADNGDKNGNEYDDLYENDLDTPHNPSGDDGSNAIYNDKVEEEEVANELEDAANEAPQSAAVISAQAYKSGAAEKFGRAAQYEWRRQQNFVRNAHFQDLRRQRRRRNYLNRRRHINSRRRRLIHRRREQAQRRRFRRNMANRRRRHLRETAMRRRIHRNRNGFNRRSRFE